MSEVYRPQPHRVDHIVDRHLVNTEKEGGEKKGDCFPHYMGRGDIRYLCELFVRSVFAMVNDRQSEEAIVKDYYQRENGAYVAQVKLTPSQYGLKEIEGVIQNGRVITLYPLRSNGNSNLWRDGKPIKKARLNK